MKSAHLHYRREETVVHAGGQTLTVDYFANNFKLISPDFAGQYLTSTSFPNRHGRRETVRLEYLSCPRDYTGADIFREIAEIPARPAYAEELLALGAELAHLPFLAAIAIDLRAEAPDRPETFFVPFIATNRRRTRLYAGVTPLSLNGPVDPRAILPESVENPSHADIVFAFVREPS